jgi:hypothetical protein
VLAAGAAELARICRFNEIPYATVDADPADERAWTAAALQAIYGVAA